MSRKLFGTDGIRGKANIYPMTGEIAMALGRAVTSYFQKSSGRKQPIIVIGKDTRRSCYMIEQAFCSGVCSQGGKAILTGPLPTPGVAFVTESMRANAGVMISASHNSFEDNGIKIFDETGHKLPDEVELELEDLIFHPEKLEVPTGEMIGKAQTLDEAIGRYIVHTKSAFKVKNSLEDLKIVVDCANGAAYKIGAMIFEELGAQVKTIGTTPNGININDKCGATYPATCAKLAKKFESDFGFCFDGDADRLIVIDDQHQVVHGDKLIGLLAKYLHETNQLGGTKEIVGTVMSNIGLELYIKSLGLEFYRAQVGDRYIIDRMRVGSSVFGGEPSGHIIHKLHSSTGDGLVAAIKTVECVKHYNRPLSELIEEIKLFPQKLVNINVQKRIPFEELPGVSELVRQCEQALGDSGRVLLRYSGTELKARVMIEAPDHESCHHWCDVIATQIELAQDKI